MPRFHRQAGGGKCPLIAAPSARHRKLAIKDPGTGDFVGLVIVPAKAAPRGKAAGKPGKATSN